MATIVSRDGTSIGFQRSGDGPPLVLVHGTSGSSARWAPVVPLLSRQYAVYAVDRRGRGDSGDSREYAIEREVEDIAVVVDSLGDPVHLLGHSWGALCALEAALLTRNIRTLILYEPPLPVPGMPIQPPGIIDQLQTLLDAGNRHGVVQTFMREVVRMPAHELERFVSSPAFPARVAAAHTLPRELRAHAAYVFDPERFRRVAVPTLLLVGGDSPAFFKAAIDALHAVLPDGRIVSLEGQQHIAIDTAPDLFAREVLAFLGGQS